jgi:imidazole glycerol phosphate synthase glutamine amidotransferase subunit
MTTYRVTCIPGDGIGPEIMAATKVAVAATGVANLASILAAIERTGADCRATSDADALADAEFAVLPGVGTFGAAMAALRERGMDRAFADRWRRGAPSLGVCLGMQLFFEASEESPGVAGLGLLPGLFRRFAGGLPLPQLGWNQVVAEAPANGVVRDTTGADSRDAVREGWAYFANTYRLASAPPGCRSWRSDYGESFVAALEAVGGAGPGARPALLLCQFHPELSGRWGAGLLSRWLGIREGASI